MRRSHGPFAYAPRKKPPRLSLEDVALLVATAFLLVGFVAAFVIEPSAWDQTLYNLSIEGGQK